MSDNTQTIQIEALDTLFFRDGKPFSMGEDTWADGIFPPPPSVIYGALRTAWASENNIPLSEIDEKTEGLVIEDITYSTPDFDLYPIPNDLFLQKNYKTSILQLSDKNFESNTEFSKILLHNKSEKREDSHGKWLTKANFNKYVRAEKDIEYEVKDIFVEPKIGIGRNNLSKTSEDGMLYRTGFIRIPEFYIKLKVKGLKFENDFFLKLGADNKLCSAKIESTENTKEFIAKSKYFKIYLKTPAIFKKGQNPEFFANKKISLITVATGKPMLIGGFDMKKKKPKPMYKAVPAGSVYYLQAESTEIIQELSDRFNGKSISDIYPEQGFGIIRLANI